MGQRRRPPQLKNSNSNQSPAAEPSGSAQQPPEPEPLPDSRAGEAHSTPSATVNTHRTHDKHSRPEASVPREQQGEKLHFSLKLPAAAVNNRFGKQLKQIPDKAKAGLAALPAGCSLTLGKTPRAMDGGFILVYGGVEENCSFSALFASRKEALQDSVQKILFP